jgi:hypothetical protein
MKKKLLRRILVIGGISLAGVIALAVIIPLFVTYSPMDGLVSAGDLAGGESAFITIPFEGTDGIDIHYLNEAGDSSAAAAFVLLHGSMYNANTWD